MSPFCIDSFRSKLLLAGVCIAAGCRAEVAAPVAREPAAETAAISTSTLTSPSTATATSTSGRDSSPIKLPTETPAEPPRLPAPEGAQAMPEPHQVWVDAKQGVVLVDGYVSLNEGLLEMFACPAGTKEHESIVAVHSSAQIVHAALLAVGAKTGHPVQWDPKFEPPSGTEIDISVRWLDKTGKWQSSPAQQWLNDLNTKKPMAHNWVFAGSGFWKDEASGKEYYLAEAGDLICVSNFSSATLDIPIESSQVNDGLLFEANTKNIPEIGTPVRLVLKPKLAKENASKEKASTEKASTEKASTEKAQRP